MPRRNRCYAPHTAHHLTVGGVHDDPIFYEDLDRLELLALVSRVTRDIGWHVVAWCLMTTHYHLLVVSGADPRIDRAMHRLNGVYAREFNVRHHRRGHLFGARYRDTSIRDDAHLGAARAYVLRNPVKAGIVRRVEDWRWSGDQSLEPRPAAPLNAAGT